MSRAPFVVEKSAKPYPATGNQTLWNTAIGWRMTNRALPTHWTISNGEAAEKTAARGVLAPASKLTPVRVNDPDEA